MKRTVLIGLLLAALVVMPAMAQNMNSPAPQFISFTFGVPVGYDLAAETSTAATSFGFNFVLADNMSVGLYNLDNTFLLRLNFAFAGTMGATIGYGESNTLNLGAFVNLFQQRSPRGFAYGMNFRLDYLVDHTADIAKGKIFFTLGMNIGI